MRLVNETLEEEDDEGRISVKTVELWWCDWVQPWKCSPSVNTSIICCIFLTTARTDWARGRERGEKQKNDVTEVTQSAASERGNGKIRNSFRDKREGETAIKDRQTCATLKRAVTGNQRLKFISEDAGGEIPCRAEHVKGTVHPKKFKLFTHPRVLCTPNLWQIFTWFLPYHYSSWFPICQAPNRTKNAKKVTLRWASEVLDSFVWGNDQKSCSPFHKNQLIWHHWHQNLHYFCK